MVLTTGRSVLPRRDKEPDGAPVSLAGRIDVKDTGSRAQRQAPKDLEKKKRRRTHHKNAAKRKAEEATGFGNADIIEATQDIKGLTYRPRTTQTLTRQAYDLILAAVHSSIGDQAQDIIRSAADTVLEVLKTDSLKDFDKEIETVLGTLPNEQFSELVSLSRKSPTTMLTTKPWVILTRRWRLTRRVELPRCLKGSLVVQVQLCAPSFWFVSPALAIVTPFLSHCESTC